MQSTSHDTGIDQTQIGLHKIIKTDANVCPTNSENKYTDKNDIKKIPTAAGVYNTVVGRDSTPAIYLFKHVQLPIQIRHYVYTKLY